MANTISYDAVAKVWKSDIYPHTKYVSQTIGAAFLENAKRTDPSKVLETYYDSGLQKTMSEIHKEAITAAVNLQRLGVKRGDVLVFYSMVNPKISGIALGCLLLGVTVNFFETTFEKEHAEYTMQLLSPTLLLYEEQFRLAAQTTVDHISLPHMKYFLSIDGGIDELTVDQTVLKAISKEDLESFTSPDLGDPNQLRAALVLTSGSTGMPKAVGLSHALLLNGVISFWTAPGPKMLLTDDSVIFSFSPMRWISQLDLMLQSLLLGVKRICANGFPSGHYGREIIRNGLITHFFSPPSVFKDILLAIEPNDLKALSSIQIIWLAGEAPAQNVIDMAAKLAPNALTYRCYGMTELAGIIATDIDVNGGYLIPGLVLKIVSDDLQAVGPNTKGQICVRTPLPFLGYYKIDNSKAYYEDGFYNTGDYGFVDDNKALHVIARYKDLLRAPDIIIVPTDVESLVTTLPDVFAAVLVGYRAESSATEDSGALFVVLNAEVQILHETLQADIRNLLRGKLKMAEFEIIRDIHVIEKFPLTSCGKVDRISLIKTATENHERSLHVLD